MADTDIHSYESKVVLLGDTGVGKTSISHRFTKGLFDSNPNATVGANYAYKTITHGTKRITLQIWDTAGQERYRSLAPMYYRGAEAAIVVFDITGSGSLNAARSWVQEITSDGDEPIYVVLVGNKCDLADMRAVPTEDALQFARSIGASYFEVSAKENTNVDAIFIELASKLLAKKTGGVVPRPSVPSGSTIYTDLKKKETTGGCCS